MTDNDPKPLAPVFDDHDREVAWFLHVTRSNGDRPYVIAIRCSGHLDAHGKAKAPRIGRATLEGASWSLEGLREMGLDQAVVADAEWTDAPEYRGPFRLNAGDRLDVSRLLRESTVEASAARPRRQRAPGQGLRVRVAWVCNWCRDSVPFKDDHELGRVLDEFASRGIHTVDLDSLRTHLRALRGGDSTLPPVYVE